MPDSILAGFNTAAAAERETVRKQQALRDQQELSILQMLAGAVDKDVAAKAVAGLLDFASPRRKMKGLSGFLGETEGHPALPLLKQLITTPDLHFNAGFPPGQITEQLKPAGEVGSAALPSTTPATGGPVTTPAGPPAAPAAARPNRYAAGPPPSITATPRRIFSSGPYEDRVRGLVEAQRAYGIEPTPEQIQQYALEVSGFSGYGARGVAGGNPYWGEGEIVPDPQSPTGYSQIMYLRSDPRQTQRLPAMPKAGGAGAGLSTVINPVTGEVYVINKPGVMAGTPGSVQPVPGPGAPPAAPAATGVSGSPAAVAAPPTGPTAAPAQVPAATAKPGLNVGGIADRTQARQRATLLTAEENHRYGTPSGTTWGDVEAKQLVPHTDAELVAIDDVDRALTLLPQIRALTQQLFTGTLSKAARALPFLPGVGERVAQEIQLTGAMNSPEYARLQSLIAQATPGAARISGQRGNLSEQEQTRARQSFPNLGEGALSVPDTLASALGRLDQLATDLQQTRRIFATPLGQMSQAPPGPGSAAAPLPSPGPPPAAPGMTAAAGPASKQFVEDHEGIWVVEDTLPNGQLQLREATPQEKSAYFASRGVAPAAPGGKK